MAKGTSLTLSEDIFAPVDPVYRIPDIPIDPDRLVERALDRFWRFAADRTEWVQQQEEFYLGWDDYSSPTRKGQWEGASNFHLPNTEAQCMAMHARLMQGFFFIDPMFYIDALETVSTQRIVKAERYMKYIITRGSNHNEGIYSAVDDWCWDLSTGGMGIFSRDWCIEQRRYAQVVDNPDFKNQKLDLESLLTQDLDQDIFMKKANEILKKPYKEVMKVRTVFNGSIVRAEDPAYILFKGNVIDSTDLNLHETVIKVCYFSKNELIAFKNSEYMDADVIDAILEREPDRKGSTEVSMRNTVLEYFKDRVTGIKTVNPSITEDTYEFLCVWDKIPLNSKGRASLSDRLVYFVHPASKKLARWTFLDRVSANGKIPLHMAHLYRRPRRSTGRGIVQTQYSINEVQDILVNQSITSGMLANNPMFAYKGDSTMDPGDVKVESGLGIKCDDPNTDIRMLTWPINPTWSYPLLGLLSQASQQLTSIGPNSFGQVGGRVGPLRSSQGVRDLLGETGVNLDVVIRRAKICMSSLFEGLYMDNVDRMPKSIEVSVTGAEGIPIRDQDGVPIRDEMTKEELRFKLVFGLYANSTNMNRLTQKEDAMAMASFLMQPIGLKTGIVRPENVYEIYDEVLTTMGKSRRDRFISKPKTPVNLPLEYEVMMCVKGSMPVIYPIDIEHEQKMQALQEIKDIIESGDDQQMNQLMSIYGPINPNAVAILDKVIMEHAKFLDMMQKPTNMQNVTGLNQSPTLGLQGGEGPVNTQAEDVSPDELAAAQETNPQNEGQ